MNKITLLRFPIFVCLIIYSVTKVSAQPVKRHFDIQNTSSAEEQLRYYEALKDFNFEPYRFYDKRRTIKFSNSNVTIDLYSAKELLNLYNREIHPSNISDNIPKQEIQLIYFPEDGKVKTDFSKK